MPVIYDYPEYCQLLFGTRDISAETNFLRTLIDRYSTLDVKNVLEVCCGNALHAGELANHGYRFFGLDRNRNMLDHDISHWRHLEPKPVFIEGDMMDFTSPEPIDFAYVMIGSLYFESLDDMTRHFDAMARAIRPGGLYFLDWCVQFSDPASQMADKEIVREENGIEISSRFKIRVLDVARQFYEEVWTISVNDHGRRRTFEMIERNKAIFPQEFLLFLESRTQFEFVGWWDQWDLSKPVDGRSDIIRPSILIRRK
uniref:Methyltransferase domain-containing protein n=1 Tax=uncultured bacterium pAW1 TaxID=1781155 RepID=A0A1C9U4R2_9BACT|nr:hypothetical protein [uncultured bacterium pAW1]